MKLKIYGKSMEPHLKEGDIVFVKEKKNLKRGDIVSYLDKKGRVVTHRIFLKLAGLLFVKGDNCRRFEKIREKEIIGKM